MRKRIRLRRAIYDFWRRLADRVTELYRRPLTTRPTTARIWHCLTSTLAHAVTTQVDIAHLQAFAAGSMLHYKAHKWQSLLVLIPYRPHTSLYLANLIPKSVFPTAFSSHVLWLLQAKWLGAVGKYYYPFVATDKNTLSLPAAKSPSRKWTSMGVHLWGTTCCVLGMTKYTDVVYLLKTYSDQVYALITHTNTLPLLVHVFHMPAHAYSWFLFILPVSLVWLYLLLYRNPQVALALQYTTA